MYFCLLQVNTNGHTEATDSITLTAYAGGNDHRRSDRKSIEQKAFSQLRVMSSFTPARNTTFFTRKIYDSLTETR